MSDTPVALTHKPKAQFDFATKLPLLENENAFLADILVRYVRLRVSVRAMLRVILSNQLTFITRLTLFK
jgi:hypothetical protein